MTNLSATSSPVLQSFITKAGAQVYRLPLEAFPGFWTYACLIFVDDYVVLVDCGSGHPDSNKYLETGFEQVSQNEGRPVHFDDLTHILITHGHIDHFGGLVYLRGRTRAKIGVHELDMQTLSRHEERLALMSRRLLDFLGEAGFPEAERVPMIQTYKFTKALYHSVPVDFTYETVGMKIGPFELIHLPGHCPGHVAIRLHDFVFSGDHLLEGITPHQAPEQLVQSMGVGHYFDSLSLFERWAEGARLVLGGHNAPIENLSDCASNIRQQLALRLHKTLEVLKEPHTIAEVAACLYSEASGYFTLLALEKTGAFVEYLYQRNLLEIVNLDELESGNQPVAVKYHRLRDVTNSDILPKEEAYVFV